MPIHTSDNAIFPQGSPVVLGMNSHSEGNISGSSNWVREQHNVLGKRNFPLGYFGMFCDQRLKETSKANITEPKSINVSNVLLDQCLAQAYRSL